MTASSESDYIHWTDPRVEPPVPNEAQNTNDLTTIIEGLSHKHFSSHRHATRVTHVKTQAIAKGTLTIPRDLPPHLAQGLFSAQNAGEHPVAFRFANERIHLEDDRDPGPRGVGMKVFNVQPGSEGFLDERGAESQTHDMTFNNAPVLELRDAQTCLDIFRLRSEYYRDPKGYDKELAKRSDTQLQKAPQQLPNHHILGFTMYSQAAYRFGEHVAKFALAPASEMQAALADEAPITDGSDPEQHRLWLQNFFEKFDAEYDLKAQLCRDIEAQPVEDASVEWDEKKFPFETVGKIVIPKGQDVFSAERRVFWDDGMKLNPWYGLTEHRPLGSVNRLRKQVYEKSASLRAEMNARAPKVISSIDEIP